MYDVDPVDDLGDIADDLLPALAEVRAALEISPWTVGRPWVAANTTGMRVVTLGEGRALLVFGVLDRERRVALFELVVL